MPGIDYQEAVVAHLVHPQTGDAVDLVHEAWMRLAGGQPFEGRSHF